MPTTCIGERSPTAAELFREQGFTPFRQILTPQLFRNAWDCAIRHGQVLIPEVVFWLMACASLHNETMTGAVVQFWASFRPCLPWPCTHLVTEEAFCAARKAIPRFFFRRVFCAIVDRFESLHAARFRWRGLRLLGIDGMKLNLPSCPGLRALYPPASNAQGASRTPQALLVGLVGLWDGVCRGFHLVASKTSEQLCALHLFRLLRPGDLALADRNFPGYRCLAAVHAQKADFLFHLSKGRYTSCKRMPTPSARQDEWYAELSLPNRQSKHRAELPPTLTVRILQYQVPGFRVSWLITSLLDVEAFPYEELVGLYHERWRQETMHREWKHTLSMSNLRSHSRPGIHKEILVQLTLNNVIRWILAEAVEEGKRPVDLKFLQARRLIVKAIRDMAAAPAERLGGIYLELLATLRKERIRVRPGRRYPRPWDDVPRNKGHGEYAIPAKLPDSKETPMTI